MTAVMMASNSFCSRATRRRNPPPIRCIATNVACRRGAEEQPPLHPSYGHAHIARRLKSPPRRKSSCQIASEKAAKWQRWSSPPTNRLTPERLRSTCKQRVQPVFTHVPLNPDTMVRPVNNRVNP